MPFPAPGSALRFSLPDGTPVLLRPITPEDKHHLEAGLKRLSLRSRQTRFFTPLPHLSEAQLRYLTEVDQHHHVAWGVLTEEEVPLGLGVGRFTRPPDAPDTAEVAVTVIDEYQHRGVGSLLLAVLYRAAQRLGVRRFHAYVLLENEALVRSLQALGGTLGQHAEGAVEVDLPILDEGEALPADPGGEYFARLLARVDEALDANNDQPSQKEA